MTVDEMLKVGVQHHQSGRLAEAEGIYKQVLKTAPQHPNALRLLGRIAAARDQNEIAIDLLKRAIAADPRVSIFHNDLAVILKRVGRLDESIAASKRAIQYQPDNFEAYNSLGNCLFQQKNLSDAIAAYRRAVTLRPDSAEVNRNLGIALLDQGYPDQALEMYDRAISLKPNYAEAYFNRGIALADMNLTAEAIASYRAAIQLEPHHADWYYNLGVQLRQGGAVHEAISVYNCALALNPNHAEVLNNLGNLWKDLGMLEDAVSCFRQAIIVDPKYRGADDNILYCLTFLPTMDSATLHTEGKRWNNQHVVPLRTQIQPHKNERNPERRLRIGYVSPDFRDHPVGRFMLSLLDSHDRSIVEVFCYSDVKIHDDMTRQLQAQSQDWKNTLTSTDEQLAQVIREDRIDILVDLTLHMAYNRLLVFARKPAPVQVTFAGYPGSTGLDVIDYRLSDKHLDPPGMADEFYSEKTIRLPDTFWCDHRLYDDPPVSTAPAHINGYITFGSLNNFCKVSGTILSHWSKILCKIPGSHLLLLVADSEARTRVLQHFALDGIESNRIEFIAFQPRSEYLKTYHRIDIGLDTWPYNGHATSFDSFWMGVPVVTLVGPTVVGRAGVSQLTNLALTDLIGHTPEEFVKIAVDLANDLPRLTELRAGMRARMRKSPLMDANQFAREMEAAYRSMWKTWCQT
jgi:protein O-GlcNAc transferase